MRYAAQLGIASCLAAAGFTCAGWCSRHGGALHLKSNLQGMSRSIRLKATTHHGTYPITNAPTGSTVPVSVLIDTAGSPPPTNNEPSSRAVLPTAIQDALRGPFPVRSVGPFHWKQADDGTVHINGDWPSPYCKGGRILQSDAKWIDGGTVLQLSVPGGTGNAGEWETDAGMSPDSGKTYPYGRVGYGYGYYAITMKTGYGPANGIPGSSAGGTGTTESFFLKGLSHGNLVNPEVDIEFLTNGRWDRPGSHRGVVWFTLYDRTGHSNGSKRFQLPFNPSAKFHKYGILFQPGTATWYIDGKPVQTQKVSDAQLPGDGLAVMANDWTGNSNWGGTQPATTITAEYKDLIYRPTRLPSY